MKKNILTAFMSLFLIIGITMVLTATEVKEKEKKSGCAGATVEMTQTPADKKAACGESSQVKTTSGCKGEVKGTNTSKVSGCAKKCGGDKTKTGSAPGECTKVPSGVGSQRTDNR